MEKVENVRKPEWNSDWPLPDKLIKNKAITFYYKNAKLNEKELSNLLDGFLSTRFSKESEIIQADKYKFLRDIVSTLPPREKVCVEMRFFQEMSIEPIAERLGITEKAVEKSITSGLKRLRKYKSSMY